MPLVWGVTRIVSSRQEQLQSPLDLALATFAEAYDALRRNCPKGDVRIHLSVEGSAEDVGLAPDAEWAAQS